MISEIYVIFSTEKEMYTNLQARQFINDKLLQMYIKCVSVAAFVSEEVARRHCTELTEKHPEQYYFVEEIIVLD